MKRGMVCVWTACALSAFAGAACSSHSSSSAESSSGDSPPIRPVDAPGATVSRAVFALRPVGIVPYTGPMLPLSSPGADFLAVPQGAPVPWPAVLAQTQAAPDPSSRIRVYALKGRSTIELTWSNTLPRGLILGRSCDDHGFLVEAPQADGSRWIGRVDWSDGKLDWLVKGAALNAHAALGPGGRLVHTARPAHGGPGDIIVHVPGLTDPIRIPAPPDSTFFAPWFEGSRIAALLLSSAGIELVRLSLDPGSPGAIVGRRMLAPGATSAGLAFQIVASQQLAIGRRAGEPDAIFDPSINGMAALDETGGNSPLEPGSMGAAKTGKHPGPGWLVTTPDGLTFRSVEAIAAKRPDRVRISDVPFLPRLTPEPGRFLLLGPSTSGVSPSLQILMLETAPQALPTPKTTQTGSDI